ncbi:MAG: hypothetical protein GY854_22720 [Deltaproteobacteria bacterium]|nr:hypothetical protein [Deltaproteobacteria bacterium]
MNKSREKQKPESGSRNEPSDKKSPEPARPEVLVAVYDHRPEGYDGTCLRPLGLCDLGGCCDTCWYRPDHPRHKES